MIAPADIRTHDLWVTSPALYQLSYVPLLCLWLLVPASFFYLHVSVWGCKNGPIRACLCVSVSVSVCESYVVHHLMGTTGLHCAPPTSVVHQQAVLCIMVRNWCLYLWEMGVTPNRGCTRARTYNYIQITYVSIFEPTCAICTVGSYASLSVCLSVLCSLDLTKNQTRK